MKHRIEGSSSWKDSRYIQWFCVSFMGWVMSLLEVWWPNMVCEVSDGIELRQRKVLPAGSQVPSAEFLSTLVILQVTPVFF